MSCPPKGAAVDEHVWVSHVPGGVGELLWVIGAEK